MLRNGGRNGKVNEERLQFAIAAHLLKQKDEKAFEVFTTAFRSADKKGANGVENATKDALKQLVQDGLLSRKEAREINGISFGAAQLDKNTDALYDGRGGKSDPTRTRRKIEKAIAKATEALEQHYSGAGPLPPRKLSAQSTPLPLNSESAGVSSSSASSSVKHPAGFLWKPESARDGNLVVLLPTELRGEVLSANIYSALPASESTLIEEGTFTGAERNGERAHYRFDRPGGSYPNGSYVVAMLKGGDRKVFQVADTSVR